MAVPWIVSVDDHVVEPLDLFDRAPGKLRDGLPTVWRDDDGIPYWVVDGQKLGITVPNGAAGRPMSEWNSAAQKLEDFRLGVHDARARLADMDTCGVWASLNFPSIPWGFTGWRFAKMENRAAGRVAFEVYNDWMLEWCSAAPERFIPCQIAWLADPQLAAADIRRNAERGFVAVSFSENPEGLGFPSLYSGHWDPFFAACEETGTVVNLHVGSSGMTQQPSSASPVDVTVALFPVNGMMALVDWIYSKIPVRFPGLKIAMSEAGVSWVPALIERLGRAYRQAETSTCWTPQDPDPVEIVGRNFWFTSIEDPSGFRALDLIGEDRVMVETDYPHCDTTWPLCQDMIRRELHHLPAATIQRVCFRNAAALYRHAEPPSEWLARSVIGAASA